MIQTQMVVILVTCVKHIRPSAAAAVAAMKRQSSTQNLTEAGREHAGPLLNGQIQILN
jgi:hypothetical protein